MVSTTATGDLVAHRRERPRRLRHHALALLLLLGLHGVVFAPWLVTEADRLPAAIIPWDFVDSYHRFLVFIGDAIGAGSLPLWFPYGNAGIPYFLNPQNQLWSPLTWVVSLLSGYSLAVAQRQVILVLLLGAVGSYVLAHQLCRRRMAALFAAIAYSFTSARLGNLEHLDIVNAFSLYPWLFWGVHRVAQARWWAMPVLAFTGFCFIVSGYPGVVLISPLYLGAWAAYVVFERHRAPLERRRAVLALAFAGGLATLLAAGYWLPIGLNMGVFTRGEPLGVAAALRQSLTFEDVGSLVFAWASHAIPGADRTDVSMRGLYIGIVALPFAAAAVVARRDRLSAAIAIGTLGALLMALGAATPLRLALNTYLPLLNLSRFPAADSRGVAALGMCLLCGLGFAKLEDGSEQVRRFVARAYVVGVCLVMVAPWLLRSTLFATSSVDDFTARVLSPTFGQLLWLVASLGILHRGVRGGALTWALCAVAALDSSVHVQVDRFLLGQSLTAAARTALVNGHVRAFSAADAMKPRALEGGLTDIRNNAAYSSKQFYLGSYGPFRLKSFDALIAAGFAEWLRTGPRLLAFAGEAIPSDSAQFVAAGRPVSFSIDRYVPDRVDYTLRLPEKATVVFNEMYFDGWMARIDDGPNLPMLQVAGGLRALALSAGNHKVRTHFSPRSFWLGAAGSLGGFLMLIACSAWLARPRRSSRPAARSSVSGSGKSDPALVDTLAPSHAAPEPMTVARVASRAERSSDAADARD